MQNANTGYNLWHTNDMLVLSYKHIIYISWNAFLSAAQQHFTPPSMDPGPPPVCRKKS